MELRKGYYGFLSHQTWSPSVNLYETEECYSVCVDLAGVDKQKIDIEVVEQRLILRGTRLVPEGPPECNKGGKRARMHLLEIDHGPFSRAVELPQNVDRDKIIAKYIDGMLWIDLPKKG
jgi:HSP20 family protein